MAERRADQPLTILTYNYDRSLDYYLYRAISNTFDHAPKEMGEVMRHLKIVHIHGQLCRLPWEEHGGFPRSYGVDRGLSHIKNAADQIKIIHENSHDTVEYSLAHDALRVAETICFIGFGYHHRNLERLLHGQWHKSPLATVPPRNRLFVGSVFGMTSAEVNLRLAPFGAEFTRGEFGDDCLAFLREHAGVIS